MHLILLCMWWAMTGGGLSFLKFDRHWLMIYSSLYIFAMSILWSIIWLCPAPHIYTGILRCKCSWSTPISLHIALLQNKWTLCYCNVIQAMWALHGISIYVVNRQHEPVFKLLHLHHIYLNCPSAQIHQIHIFTWHLLLNCMLLLCILIKYI